MNLTLLAIVISVFLPSCLPSTRTSELDRGGPSYLKASLVQGSEKKALAAYGVKYFQRRDWDPGYYNPQAEPLDEAWNNALPKRFVIHHTYLKRPGSDDSSCFESARKLKDFHLNRKFSDVGYNFIMCPNGTVLEGRIGEGQHSWMQNQASIGIVFQGNFETKEKLEADGETIGEDLSFNNLSEKEKDSLAALILVLAKKFKIEWNSKAGTGPILDVAGEVAGNPSVPAITWHEHLSDAYPNDYAKHPGHDKAHWDSVRTALRAKRDKGPLSDEEGLELRKAERNYSILVNLYPRGQKVEANYKQLCPGSKIIGFLKSGELEDRIRSLSYSPVPPGD